MKLVVINGSPKGRRSNTDIIVRSLLRGAEEAGARTTNIFLAEKNINHCNGCVTCWVDNPGRCVIDDDMMEIISQLGDADVIILATPIYCENMTSLLKVFIDRLTVVANPYSYVNANSKQHGPQELTPQSPKLMMISNCGFPDKEVFGVLAHWYRRFSMNMNSESIGEIYVTRGKYLGSPPDDLKPAVADYLEIVARAGQEIATTLRISEGTKTLLDKPFTTK